MNKNIKVLRLFLAILLVAFCAPMSAEEQTDSTAGRIHDITLDVRRGINIGGVMPLSMPASIRGLNSYTPQLNPQLALYASTPLGRNFGLMSGVRIERKAMKTDARVKGYHMVMTRGGESVEGLFTGNVATKSSTWGVTVPVFATYAVCNAVQMRLGPYLSLLFSKTFGGHAYEGYLRKDTPTGERVEIGTTPETWGDYNFNDDMRSFQLGMDLGVDWRLSDKFGFYADLQWGLTDAFKSSFATIEQTMYPIYGTIGIFKTL